MTPKDLVKAAISSKSNKRTKLKNGDPSDRKNDGRNVIEQDFHLLK